MAPKQAKETENPPMVSSSEKEDEESGSSVQESDEESESESGEESSEEEDQEKPIQTNVVVPLATKPRPESSAYDEAKKKMKRTRTEATEEKISEDDDKAKKNMKKSRTETIEEDETKTIESGSFVQESGEESESGEETESGEEEDQEKPIQTNVVVPLVTKPRTESLADDEAKKKMKRTRTEATEEEISKANDDEAKTSMKKSRTEETKISEDETKKQQTPFQRLFSGEDELALLQGLLDFASTKGDPSKDTDGFCDFMKKLISFNASKRQLLNKVGKLKQKFGDTVKKSLEKGKGGEDKIVFSKGFEQKAFELSRKIWGSAGVLASKSRKKKDKPETNVATTPPSFGREVVSFFKDENLTSFGLDESTVLARWNMVPDGPKKRAMEEKLKRFKAMKVELCLKRIECVADTANLIFKEDIASSSSGKQMEELLTF